MPGGGIPPRLVREGADDAASLVDQVRGDQRDEEHALRADEGPDRNFAAVEAGAGVVV